MTLPRQMRKAARGLAFMGSATRDLANYAGTRLEAAISRRARREAGAKTPNALSRSARDPRREKR
jgi:hypothetical protein